MVLQLYPTSSCPLPLHPYISSGLLQGLLTASSNLSILLLMYSLSLLYTVHVHLRPSQSGFSSKTSKNAPSLWCPHSWAHPSWSLPKRSLTFWQSPVFPSVPHFPSLCFLFCELGNFRLPAEKIRRARFHDGLAVLGNQTELSRRRSRNICNLFFQKSKSSSLLQVTIS